MNQLQIKNYLDNLNEEGAKFALNQLILYHESRVFLKNYIEEFDKFYRFPIGKDIIK